MARFLVAQLLSVTCIGTQAQTVPSELLDMSIEDLFQMRVVADIEAVTRSTSPWLLGYTYQIANFEDYSIGTDSVDARALLWSPADGPRGQNEYLAVTPKITQEVHALNLSYSLSPLTVITGQLPWVQQDTDHIAVIPGWPEFTVHSEALGDASLSVSHQLKHSNSSAWNIHAGISLPTGSIDERALTPAGPDTVLPYTMQTGSGTWDFTGGVSYIREREQFHWGIDGHVTIRTGRNSREYRLGNKGWVNLWSVLTVWESLRPGVQLSLNSSGAITGRDPVLPSADPLGRYPTAVLNPENYGGNQIDAVLFVRYQPGTSRWYLDARYAEPIYLDLNGPQVAVKSSIGFSIGYSF